MRRATGLRRRPVWALLAALAVAPSSAPAQGPTVSIEVVEPAGAWASGPPADERFAARLRERLRSHGVVLGDAAEAAQRVRLVARPLGAGAATEPGAELAATAVDADVAVVLLLPPPRERPLTDAALTRERQTWHATARAPDRRVVDPTPDLARTDGVRGEDGAPSAVAHERVAHAALRALAVPLGLLPATPRDAPDVPLYDRIELVPPNARVYANPFADVELHGVFRSPSGRTVHYQGFYDGEPGAPAWRLRFMPDEVGDWSYLLVFSDGSPGMRGGFRCVAEGARPGPWRQDPDDARWLRTARGEPFLPVGVLADAPVHHRDVREAIAWARARGYNTIFTATLNSKNWAEGWPNVTPFATADAAARTVDYARMNVPMWRQWDAMLREAGEAGLYIGPMGGPAGDYGGRSGEGTVWPPAELAYGPVMNEAFDTPRNLRVLHYLVARQGGFWNLAFWNLYAGEIQEVKPRDEVIRYGEYLASQTPFGRMLSAQDIEQHDAAGTDRRWLAAMRFPSARKLNHIQAGAPDSGEYVTAAANFALARETTARGFPVIATEALWEGQPRALRPVSIIWGNLMAGAHTVWADWSYDDGIDGGRWGSLGRSWIPIRPLAEPVFRDWQLGADTVGDEYLRVAADIVESLSYWHLRPQPERVAGGDEAYALVETGRQLLVYMPGPGELRLDLRDMPGVLAGHWLDPRTGRLLGAVALEGGAVRRLAAPLDRDQVLRLTRP